MSFDIPILFNNDSFFDDDPYFRRQPRKRREPDEERQSDVFQTWPTYHQIFEEPRESFFNRTSYRPRREVPTKPLRRSEPHREYEENEDIDDLKELGGVTGDMRDLRGLGGWDIPVQFVGSPDCKETRRHRNPQQNRRPNVEKEQVAEKNRERMENEAPRACHEKSNIHNENEFRKKEKTRMESEPKNVSVQDEKSADSNENKENESNIEIPVQHSFKREKSQDERRNSRRLSHCDPPPLAEIKVARIKSILQKIDGIEEKIKEFNDPIQNKKFLFISETLTSVLLDLDNIDSDGLDMVRNARKEAVRIVQVLIEKLENKLAENKSN